MLYVGVALCLRSRSTGPGFKLCHAGHGLMPIRPIVLLCNLPASQKHKNAAFHSVRSDLGKNRKSKIIDVWAWTQNNQIQPCWVCAGTCLLDDMKCWPPKTVYYSVFGLPPACKDFSMVAEGSACFSIVDSVMSPRWWLLKVTLQLDISQK
jgi:hypothetical protein